jgi:hypothetical protein
METSFSREQRMRLEDEALSEVVRLGRTGAGAIAVDVATQRGLKSDARPGVCLCEGGAQRLVHQQRGGIDVGIQAAGVSLQRLGKLQQLDAATRSHWHEGSNQWLGNKPAANDPPRVRFGYDLASTGLVSVPCVGAGAGAGSGATAGAGAAAGFAG